MAGNSTAIDAVVGAPLSPQMIALFREAMHFDSLEKKDIAAHCFVVFGASVSKHVPNAPSEVGELPRGWDSEESAEAR